VKPLHLALSLLFAGCAFAGAPQTESTSIYEHHCSYPDDAKGATGDVYISFAGNNQGRAENVVIDKSSGNPSLDKAGLDCLAAYRFNASGALGAVNQSQNHVILRWIPDPASGTLVGHFLGRSHVCKSPHPVPEPPAGPAIITLVQFTITEQGLVRDPQVLQSSGIAVLDADALECVRTWTYRPAIKAGVPIAVPWKAEVLWRKPGETMQGN
jgi:TonB family protein